MVLKLVSHSLSSYHSTVMPQVDGCVPICVLSSSKFFIVHLLRKICSDINFLQNFICSFRKVLGITRQVLLAYPLNTGSDL